MDKKRFLHILQWGIGLAALVYLVWRLATYDDYAALSAGLRAMGWPQWIALGLCVALMPVNMALEAWRWRTLIPMSWREAQRQVYYSKLAGLITPWRLGEYPARGVLMSSEQPSVSDSALWPKVLSMGAVGSATMTIAIVIAGVVGLAFSPSVFAYLGGSYLYSLCGVVVLLVLLFALAPRVLRKYAELNDTLILTSIGQSLLRLLCWCVQLALVLWALGVFRLSTFTFQLLPVYYLLVTVTPNVPIVEAGVRGAWAIFLFGTPNAALAGVLLWAVNTLLPCAIWPFFRKKSGKFARIEKK